MAGDIVGRATELLVVGSVIARARGGHGGRAEVALEGEAGTGKTTRWDAAVDEVVFSLFTAGDEAFVRELNERAGFPDDRIARAISLTAAPAADAHGGSPW